ncbi:MAG TPA: alpha/beta hydrolase [Devosia sp.]
MLRRTLLAAAALAGLTLALPLTTQSQEQQMQNPTPTKSGYAPANGVEVYYAVYGEGSPIVLLHGGLMSGSSFAPIIDTMAENHQVVTIDLQGHGHTLPFDRPMTFEAMADDVAGVIEHLGLEKPAILGYSLGSTTALRVGIQHPDLVSKLVLVSAPFAFDEGWHDFNREGMRSMTAAQADGIMQSPMGAAYAAEAPDVKNFPVLLDKVGDMMRAGFDYSEDVKQLKVPTMLVFADWDAVRTSHVAKFWELLGGGLQDAGWDGANMNQNRLAILPGFTHYNMVSPQLAQAALGFIDGQ